MLSLVCFPESVFSGRSSTQCTTNPIRPHIILPSYFTREIWHHSYWQPCRRTIDGRCWQMLCLNFPGRWLSALLASLRVKLLRLRQPPRTLSAGGYGLPEARWLLCVSSVFIPSLILLVARWRSAFSELKRKLFSQWSKAGGDLLLVWFAMVRILAKFALPLTACQPLMLVLVRLGKPQGPRARDKDSTCLSESESAWVSLVSSFLSNRFLHTARRHPSSNCSLSFQNRTWESGMTRRTQLLSVKCINLH